MSLFVANEFTVNAEALRLVSGSASEPRPLLVWPELYCPSDIGSVRSRTRRQPLVRPFRDPHHPVVPSCVHGTWIGIRSEFKLAATPRNDVSTDLIKLMGSLLLKNSFDYARFVTPGLRGRIEIVATPFFRDGSGPRKLRDSIHAGQLIFRSRTIEVANAIVR